MFKYNFCNSYNAPYVCRKCQLDCNSCKYGGDINKLKQVDELNRRKKLRQKELMRLIRDLDKIDLELKELEIK